MSTPLPCGVQDMLEAAIVQKRRLDVICLNQDGEDISYQRILPLDIKSREGTEWLHFMYADRGGDIRRVEVNTALIKSFQAVDNQQPTIHYRRD